jgi:hypothetical protein
MTCLVYAPRAQRQQIEDHAGKIPHQAACQRGGSKRRGSMAALSVYAHHASNPRRAPGRSEIEIRGVIVRRVVHHLARPVSALSASLPPGRDRPLGGLRCPITCGTTREVVTLRSARRAGGT